jgi:hypothetical protein
VIRSRPPARSGGDPGLTASGFDRRFGAGLEATGSAAPRRGLPMRSGRLAGSVPSTPAGSRLAFVFRFGALSAMAA